MEEHQSLSERLYSTVHENIKTIKQLIINKLVKGFTEWIFHSAVPETSSRLKHRLGLQKYLT